MDKAAMREHMEAIRAELTRIEGEQEALREMLHGYERWFRLHSENGTQQLEMAVGVRGRRPKGTISFREGVRNVLRQARGEPLGDSEIWTRMQSLGVESDAKNPVGFVGLAVKRLPEVEKVAARTFRWIGRKNGR